MSNSNVPKSRDVRIPARERGLHMKIDTLTARVEELEALLSECSDYISDSYRGDAPALYQRALAALNKAKEKQ